MIQGGRSSVFPAGTPLDAIFDSLSPDSDVSLNLSVTSPIVVIEAVLDAMFEKKSSGARDVSNNTILRIATARGVHPDSVRIIASTIFTHWKAGIVPFIVMTSYHVPDLSLPISSRANASNRVCIDYRTRTLYNPLRDIATLECDSESVCSDATNYIYKPTVQPDAGTIRLVIASYGSMYNGGQTKKLRACMTEVRAFDAAWIRSITAAMEGRMTPLLVNKLCMYIANHVEPLVKGEVELSFSMRREGSLVRFSLPTNGKFDFNGPSLVAFNEAIRAENGNAAQCCKCDLRRRVIRCQYCDDLRYCTRDCALADEVEHTKTCRVYIRRNAVDGPRAPGGVIVMKESEQKKE